jgi:hypothetical protein
MKESSLRWISSAPVGRIPLRRWLRDGRYDNSDDAVYEIAPDVILVQTLDSFSQVIDDPHN